MILVDARNGVLAQTRRHSFIVSLLGIQQVVVAINKMDLVDYAHDGLRRDREEYRDFAARSASTSSHFIPLSALEGDNVAPSVEQRRGTTARRCWSFSRRSTRSTMTRRQPFRMPVQWVNRPNLDFRGFGGRIESGDGPSRRPRRRCSRRAPRARSRGSRRSTATWRWPAPRGAWPSSWKTRVDASRGDMIVALRARSHDRWWPIESPRIVVWMHEERASTRAGSSSCATAPGSPRAACVGSLHRLDVDTLETVAVRTALGLNEIGRVELETDVAAGVRSRTRQVRGTGSLILVDRIGNWTMAAGMIRGKAAEAPLERQARSRARTGIGEEGLVSAEERASRGSGRSPSTVLLTGLAGSGKTRIAAMLERALFDLGRVAIRLDGTTMRQGVESGPRLLRRRTDRRIFAGRWRPRSS